MIRCIAFDLDDTLLNDDLMISDENREMIRLAIQQGIKIVPASGRMVQSMLRFANTLNLKSPMIAYNGAVIYDLSLSQISYRRSVELGLALEIIPLFQKAGLHLNVYVDDELFMDHPTSWGEKYASLAGVTPRFVGPLDRFLKEAPHKLLCAAEMAETDRMQALLSERFGDRLQLTRSKPNYLEMLDPGASKGQALQELAGRWGFDRSEVMAIGDAPNDISMITWAGVGVAMRNAVDLLKEKANLIVADNNHNGVAEAIRKVVYAT